MKTVDDFDISCDKLRENASKHWSKMLSDIIKNKENNMIELKVKHRRGNTELLSFTMLDDENVPADYLNINNVGDIYCYSCENGTVIQVSERISLNETEEQTLEVGEIVSRIWFKSTFVPLLKRAGLRLTDINKTTLETIQI